MKNPIWERNKLSSLLSVAKRSYGEVTSPPRRYTWFLQLGILILLLMIVVGTSACGRQSSGLKRIQDAGKLRVATDPSFPPFEFVDGDGQVAGIDADLARLIAARLGVEAHFVTTGYDALYDALTAGHADVIISALYPDPSRSNGFLFTPAYFDAGQVLVVADGVEMEGVTDVAGQSIACVFGTDGHMEALRWQETLMPAPSLIAVHDPVTITQLLDAGTVHAIVLDHVSARIAASQDPSIRILLPPVTSDPYVIATRQEDATLIAAIEAILEELETEGQLDTLIQQWMQP